MKKVIIIGASSGIGKQLVLQYLKEDNCKMGICARRKENLENLRMQAPQDKIIVQEMDVCSADAEQQLLTLIEKMEGIDVFILNSGIGSQNQELNPSIEMNTVSTNVEGFTRLIITAFNYMKKQKYGHIAVTSSIAGTKGLGICPAYSATKRFQAHYTECLAQKSFHDKLNIKFTTILPGFIDTDLLKQKYPMTIGVEKAGKLIFKALQKKKRKVYIPFRWFWVVRVWQCIPRFFWERYF